MSAVEDRSPSIVAGWSTAPLRGTLLRRVASMPLARVAMLYFVFFLLVFPKGGVKIGGVPLTWGYLGLGPVLIWFAATVVSGAALPVLRTRLLILALLLPFQTVAWLGLLSHGIGDFGFTVSLLVTFFVVPFVFVLIFGSHFDRMDLRPLLAAVRVGMFVVAVYGIFLFFYKLTTGSWIEIPYLTVNAADVGELDDKHIDRGGIFKLISTYNNGNVYGVSILILLPLYCWLEPARWRRATVKFSLLLTLSRTVWIGLLLAELLQRLFVRRPSGREIGALAVVLASLTLGVWYMLTLLGVDTSFLLDRTLGGRLAQLGILQEVSLLPAMEFRGISEIVYLSVLGTYGLLGLTAFLIGMAAPLVLYAVRALPHYASSYKRSLAAGIFVYLVVAASDGAILYIPVMAFYWFVVSLLLSESSVSGDERPAFSSFGGHHATTTSESVGAPVHPAASGALGGMRLAGRSE